MYSMVLMAAMAPSGDTAGLGDHGGSGCTGTVVMSSSCTGNGCNGGKNHFFGGGRGSGCNGGGLFGKHKSNGCSGGGGLFGGHKGNGCNGGGGLFGKHHKSNGCNGGSGCHGSTVTYSAPADCCGAAAPVAGGGTTTTPPQEMPKVDGKKPDAPKVETPKTETKPIKD